MTLTPNKSINNKLNYTKQKMCHKQKLIYNLLYLKKIIYISCFCVNKISRLILICVNNPDTFPLSFWLIEEVESSFAAVLPPFYNMKLP